jgi:hypothetical protein
MEIAAKQFMVTSLVSPFAMTTEFAAAAQWPFTIGFPAASPLPSCVPTSAVLYVPCH